MARQTDRSGRAQRRLAIAFDPVCSTFCVSRWGEATEKQGHDADHG